jgi:hypothetical protein
VTPITSFSDIPLYIEIYISLYFQGGAKMLQTKRSFFFLAFVFFFLWTAPVNAAVLEGPVLDYDEQGWGDFGLLIRAEADVNLVSVRFPNQEKADIIKLRRISDSALLASIPVPAGNSNAIVAIDYPLLAGEVYSLVATTPDNKYFGSLGSLTFPTGNTDLTVLSSYRGEPGYGKADYRFWFSFNDIVTGPALNDAGTAEVLIDIKPGTDVNSINLKSRGVVPVAVLTTEDFDAVEIDSESVLFAGASPVRWQIEDINSDGYDDILFHFKTEELTELSTGSTEAVLTGATLSGTLFYGMDTVNIIPKK